MAISKDKITAMVRDAFPAAEFVLTDLVGDADHYRLQIKDQSFAGLSVLSQHRLVYKALGECLGGELHALQLETGTL